MNKRLLILGGDHFTIPVVKAAHACGCYVITADYLPENTSFFAQCFEEAAVVLYAPCVGR